MIETRRQRIEMRMGERVCASGYVREWVRCPPPPPWKERERVEMRVCQTMYQQRMYKRVSHES